MSEIQTQPAKRGRPRDPKRLQSVIQAASQQFLEHGFDRANMEAVALASGVSKMTLYNYFPSKEALFEACVACRTDGMFEDFSGGKLDPTQPAEALYRIAKQFLSLMRADDVINIHRILYGLATTHPEICARFFNAGPEHVNQLVQSYLIAAEAAGSLDISNIALATEQFIALQLGRSHLRATLGLGKPDDASDEVLLRENVVLFMARYGSRQG